MKTGRLIITTMAILIFITGCPGVAPPLDNNSEIGFSNFFESLAEIKFVVPQSMANQTSKAMGDTTLIGTSLEPVKSEIIENMNGLRFPEKLASFFYNKLRNHIVVNDVELNEAFEILLDEDGIIELCLLNFGSTPPQEILDVAGGIIKGIAIGEEADFTIYAYFDIYYYLADSEGTQHKMAHEFYNKFQVQNNGTGYLIAVQTELSIPAWNSSEEVPMPPGLLYSYITMNTTTKTGLVAVNREDAGFSLVWKTQLLSDGSIAILMDRGFPGSFLLSWGNDSMGGGLAGDSSNVVEEYTANGGELQLSITNYADLNNYPYFNNTPFNLYSSFPSKAPKYLYYNDITKEFTDDPDGTWTACTSNTFIWKQSTEWAAGDIIYTQLDYYQNNENIRILIPDFTVYGTNSILGTSYTAQKEYLVQAILPLASGYSGYEFREQENETTSIYDYTGTAYDYTDYSYYLNNLSTGTLNLGAEDIELPTVQKNDLVYYSITGDETATGLFYKALDTDPAYFSGINETQIATAKNRMESLAQNEYHALDITDYDSYLAPIDTSDPIFVDLLSN